MAAPEAAKLTDERLPKTLFLYRSMAPVNLTSRISSLVIQCLERESDTSLRQQLGAALDRLLLLPPDDEENVVAEVLDDVCEVQDAPDFFLSELELRSQLVYLGKAQDQAALLWCMPVMFMAGDQPQRLALSTDSMTSLSQLLTDTDVIGAQARVGILPRLFLPQEMVTQSYGALNKLVRLLGQQVLDGDPVRLEPGVLAEGIPVSDKFAWGDNPYLTLRYLVGVVVTHASMLDDVFPAIGDDMGEEGDAYATQALSEPDARSPLQEGQDDEPGPITDLPAPGVDEHGTSWDDLFLEAVDDVFMPLFGAQSTMLPDDFHTNVRQGLELWRQNGLQHQIRNGFHEEEVVVIQARTYRDEELGRLGWDLFLFGEDGTFRDQSPWEVLMHEQIEESEGLLRELCAKAGWTILELEPLQVDD
jgi:hypothetical protein